MCVNTLPYMCECQKTLPCVLIPENFAKCVNICVNSRKPEQKLPHYLCPLLVNQNWRLQPLEGCKRDLCLKVELLRVWFNWLDVSVIWTVFKGFQRFNRCFSYLNVFNVCNSVSMMFKNHWWVHCSIWIIAASTKDKIAMVCGANEN